MPVQHEVNRGMRAVLVDWLVEVQENFELNHETLYLGVKMVDHYLAREQTPKTQLQLVGATAMFVAGKFDVSMLSGVATAVTQQSSFTLCRLSDIMPLASGYT